MWISPLPQLQQSDSPWDLLPILYALLPSQGTTALRDHGRVRRHYSVGGIDLTARGKLTGMWEGCTWRPEVCSATSAAYKLLGMIHMLDVD